MQGDVRAGWGGFSVLLLALTLAALLGALSSPMTEAADRIENATANFSALDKVTAGVKQLTIDLNKTATFRTLKITPRICITSDPSDPPRTSTFVEVDEVLFDGSEKRIFSGWMFAESPGMNPLVHPVFDIWLTGCSQPKATTVSKAPSGGSTDTSEAPLPKLQKKRPPR